jgi:hypothetical protein
MANKSIALIAAANVWGQCYEVKNKNQAQK